jgi:hypothetical protein
LGNLFLSIIHSGCCPSSKLTTYKTYNSIPPGAADIKAEVLNISESGEMFKLKISEVLEYGSSVTPIPPGTEIESFISKTLLKDEPKELKEGEEILARISLKETRDAKKYWEIIRLNK